MERYFFEYDSPTDKLLELLNSTVLGTNGARYRHLDTTERIQQLDNPLFLCLEKNHAILGSITFCKRNTYWYIRYFSFQNNYQSSANSPSGKMKQNNLKDYLNFYFENKMLHDGVRGFYAYIDPKNNRSKQMAALFNLKTSRKLVAQTFSRYAPRIHASYGTCSYDLVKELIRSRYENCAHFFCDQLIHSKFSVLKDENGEIIACATVRPVHWEIVRLPGSFGRLATKLIPMIPVLRRFIKPSNHYFLAIDTVCVLNDNPKLLSKLLESILSDFNAHSLMWWIDQNDPLYFRVKDHLRWGILDRLIGKNEVDLVTNGESQMEKDVHYVCSLDFI